MKASQWEYCNITREVEEEKKKTEPTRAQISWKHCIEFNSNRKHSQVQYICKVLHLQIHTHTYNHHAQHIIHSQFWLSFDCNKLQKKERKWRIKASEMKFCSRMAFGVQTQILIKLASPYCGPLPLQEGCSSCIVLGVVTPLLIPYGRGDTYRHRGLQIKWEWEWERGSIELWESLRVFVHWPSFPSGKLLLSCCCCCCCFCCYYCRIPAAWQGSLVCASLATLSALITRWLQMESSPGTTHTVSKWTFQRVLHWPTIWLEGRAGGSLCNHLGFWFCGWMFSLIAGVCFFTQGLSIAKVVFFLFFGLLEDVPKSIFACMARSIP